MILITLISNLIFKKSEKDACLGRGSKVYTFLVERSTKQKKKGSIRKMNKKVWLITGGSKGLGLILTKSLLENGHQVVTTSRTKESLMQKVGAESTDFLPVSLDLMDEKAVAEVVRLALEKFGRIDVLVNNAGYMVAGAVEDLADAEVRACFDVNVFGTLNMLRAVIPVMREQRSGYIINTSSIAGLRSGAFESAYSGTKFAINGITQALAEEMKPFGIHVINAAPGFLRTEFLTETSYSMSKTISDPYRSYVEERLEFVAAMNGNQAGDPEKVAELYQTIVAMDEPPLELMVGSDGYEVAIEKAKEKIEMTEKYQDLSRSVDF
jgi:NAD(P)-dependent dehydrogenase (short-subunit alcohol dehydrogenase family)